MSKNTTLIPRNKGKFTPFDPFTLFPRISEAEPSNFRKRGSRTGIPLHMWYPRIRVVAPLGRDDGFFLIKFCSALKENGSLLRDLFVSESYNQIKLFLVINGMFDSSVAVLKIINPRDQLNKV